MSVSCDRCSERSKRLSDYENYPEAGGELVLCHACANEINEGNEK
jgi:hypothetical protein